MRTRKLAVFVTCLGLAAAFPILSSADPGGKPHAGSHGKGKQLKQNGQNGHECRALDKGKGNGRNLNDLPQQARDKGLKCGFKKHGIAPPDGQQQTTTVPSGSTSTETETEPETTSTTTSD
jgi:hypothetical protein